MTENKQQLLELGSEIGSKVTIGGGLGSAFIAFFGFLNANAAGIGVLIALGGFWMNYKFKNKLIEIERKKVEKSEVN